MKKLIAKYALPLLLIFILSCSSNEEKSPRTLSDFFIEEIRVPIGSEIDPYTMALQYVDGYLYWHNKNRRTISKIYLSTQQISEYLRYNEEGPQGVGNIDGFYILNENSITFPSSGRLVSIHDLEILSSE